MLPQRRKKTRSKPLPDRVRCPSHLKWVRGHECAIAMAYKKDVIAGGLPHLCIGKIEAAHVRMGTDGGTSLKPGDCYTIPLCEAAHGEQHRIGEPAFERRYGINMKAIAEGLWIRSPHRRKHEMETA